MKLRDDLPDDCPPPNAKTIVEELRLYRLVAQFPPKGKDFEPHWEMYPHNRETWLAEDGECDAKGLSLLTTLEAAKRRTTLRNLIGKKVAEVRLQPGSGMISPTSKSGHVTWWPSQTHHILAICVECEI